MKTKSSVILIFPSCWSRPAAKYKINHHFIGEPLTEVDREGSQLQTSCCMFYFIKSAKWLSYICEIYFILYCTFINDVVNLICLYFLCCLHVYANDCLSCNCMVSVLFEVFLGRLKKKVITYYIFQNLYAYIEKKKKPTLRIFVVVVHVFSCPDSIFIECVWVCTCPLAISTSINLERFYESNKYCETVLFCRMTMMRRRLTMLLPRRRRLRMEMMRECH